MSRRIIETGRLELKGAEVRFKQKGTLEAFDRNLGDLERVFIRSTPAPNIRLFADFVFPHDVFRVWQDGTLANYKDFLEKVELAGLENFRAMIRHVTKAGASDVLDVTSRAFAESSGPPERFVNKDELEDYGRALARGETTGSSTPRVRPPEPETAKKKAQVEEAWNELAPILAAEESTDPAGKNIAPVAGAMLMAIGFVTAAFAMRAFMKLRTQEKFLENPTHYLGPIAGGGALALAFLVVGALYVRRGATAKPPATRSLS